MKNDFELVYKSSLNTFQGIGFINITFFDNNAMRDFFKDQKPENKFMDIKGKDSRRNWEIGVHIYTSLCIK